MILRHFWQPGDDLTIEHSFMTWKGRFFIPAFVRSKCLQTLHNGHKQDTINKEIADHGQRCVPCHTISNSQQKKWVQKLSSTSTKDLISALCSYFLVIGTPEEYNVFATQWGITLTACSLHCPRGHHFI